MHRLISKDIPNKRGVCAVCGPVRIRYKNTKGGGWRCAVALHRASRGRKYRDRLDSACDRCGFVPEHPCQMDVHHRDGDHSNNDPANLQTLCANCHRLAHSAGL